MDCGGSAVVPAFVREPKDNNYVFPVAADAAVTADNSRYVILRCGDCGSVFLHPAYWQESFGVYATERYNSGYFPDNIHPGGGPNIAPARFPIYNRIRYHRRARQLLKQAGLSALTGLRVLDIGCAAGRLVQGFADLGCDAYGIDVSRPAIENACSKDLQLTLGTFEDAEYPNEFFDLIVSIETFEHMGGLDTILKQIRKKLKPSGRLVIQVPNDLSGYRMGFFRRIWWIIPPMHIRYFTPQNLPRIFDGRGLDAAAVRTFGSFGEDLSLVLIWRLKRAGLKKLTSSLPFRMFVKVLGVLFVPVDCFLNARKRHSEMIVVLTPRRAG